MDSEPWNILRMRDRALRDVTYYAHGKKTLQDYLQEKQKSLNGVTEIGAQNKLSP
jgi:hypothetical protein